MKGFRIADAFLILKNSDAFLILKVRYPLSYRVHFIIGGGYSNEFKWTCSYFLALKKIILFECYSELEVVRQILESLHA